jgi:hypothetical protein
MENFQLPEQLKNEAFSFIPLEGKNPAINGKGWEKQINRYDKVEGWLANGLNYGVMTGHGDLMVIDADSETIDKAILSSDLPPTFTVKSGGEGEWKKHRYFICSGFEEKGYFKDESDGTHGGEILTKGFQAVGPGSIHPDTKKRYSVLVDLPIASVTKEQVDLALSQFYKEKVSTARVQGAETTTSALSESSLKISDLLPGTTTGNIPHPIHGSTSGINLSIDTEKNEWHCFRCGSGGGAISLLAVMEGIILCEDAKPGGLRGENFIKAKDLARTKYGAIFDGDVCDAPAKKTALAIGIPTGFPADIPGTPQLRCPISKNGTPGVPYKDETNVLLNLVFHYGGRLKYNTFTETIEFDGTPFHDDDVGEIVAFMQTVGRMPTVSRSIVENAINTFAIRNSYDEAKEYLDSLVWDKVLRLENWLIRISGIEDTKFNRYAPANWLQNGLVNRLYNPGTQWHYVFGFIGKTGTGKTAVFQSLGGKWYKSYAGGADAKDLAILCTGVAILDLDEGVAVSKTDYARMKSFISQPVDEYRSPYAKHSAKHVRRFVFSMTTNSDTPLRDPTGNRRYWLIDTDDRELDWKWVKENRDQLFAEAMHNLKNNITLPEVPKDEALASQELALMDDPWTNDILEYTSDKNETTIKDVYRDVIIGDTSVQKISIERVDRFVEMRIAEVLKKNGFNRSREMRDGVRQMFWKRKTQITVKGPVDDFESF